MSVGKCKVRYVPTVQAYCTVEAVRICIVAVTCRTTTSAALVRWSEIYIERVSCNDVVPTGAVISVPSRLFKVG